MFNELSSIYKLLLCLLLSASVHGGLVFYDWVPSHAEPRMAHAPVVVSLLPAVDIAAPALEEKSQTQPEAVTPGPVPRVVETKQPRVVPQTKPLVSKAPTPKVLSTKPPLAVVPNEPKRESSPVESTCMEQQEVIQETQTELSEPMAELFADSQSEAALSLPDTAMHNLSTVKPQASLQAVDKGSFPVSVTQPLIEAFPNYRNNPLPKYPQIARQKHWQGVVWLLVDVSAEGLVDDLQIEQSCGYRVLDRAASQAVRRWEFSPARRAGMVVESQVRIPVRFRLEDG